MVIITIAPPFGWKTKTQMKSIKVLHNLHCAQCGYRQGGEVGGERIEILNVIYIRRDCPWAES